MKKDKLKALIHDVVKEIMAERETTTQAESYENDPAVKAARAKRDAAIQAARDAYERELAAKKPKQTNPYKFAADRDAKSPKKPANENKTLMKNIVRENLENRVNVLKVGAILEKVLPELTKEQSEKLAQLFTELSVMATQMNTLPYSKFNMQEWQLLVAGTHAKVHEFRNEIIKISEKNDSKIDCNPLIKALEEILTY